MTFPGAPSRPKKSQAVVLPLVLPPFRAERRGAAPGEWREHVEDAMEDARQLGTGSRVVSQNGVLLARFENAGKYLPKEEPKEEYDAPRRARSS